MGKVRESWSLLKERGKLRSEEGVKGRSKGTGASLSFRFLGWTLGSLGLNRYKTVTLSGLNHSRDMSYIEIVHTLI